MRIEDSPKRVRAFVGGVAVADTLRLRLVWEGRPYPGYWLPEADVRLDRVASLPEGAVRRRPEVAELEGYVHLAWGAVDSWFEEDEEVYVHPRDPYTRVDILASSRRVQVLVDGETVADSPRPRILVETVLPPRYYVPLTDLRTELLRPSDRVSACPYKGTARYWSVEVGGRLHPDLVWSYPAPLPESQKIGGLACFYNERVDLFLDGVPQPRAR